MTVYVKYDNVYEMCLCMCNMVVYVKCEVWQCMWNVWNMTVYVRSDMTVYVKYDSVYEIWLYVKTTCLFRDILKLLFIIIHK